MPVGVVLGVGLHLPRLPGRAAVLLPAVRRPYPSGRKDDLWYLGFLPLLPLALVNRIHCSFSIMAEMFMKSHLDSSMAPWWCCARPSSDMFQRSPRHTLIAPLACICVGPRRRGLTPARRSPTQLDDRARAFAPSARLAQADVTVAEQRSVACRRAVVPSCLAAQAWTTRARRPIPLSRDYQRTQMHLGVRWPPGHARAAQQRTVDDAQHTVEQSRLRRLQMENEAVLAVRRAYVRHLRSVWSASAWRTPSCGCAPGAGAIGEPTRRWRAAGGRPADLGGLFNIVQATHDSQSAARDLARPRSSALTGQPAAAVQTQEPAWPQTCLAPAQRRWTDPRRHAGTTGGGRSPAAPAACAPGRGASFQCLAGAVVHP